MKHFSRFECVLVTLATLASIPAQTFVAGATQIGGATQVSLAPPPPPPVDELKKEYLRPATVPFPASNPYTKAKADLGKTLFFDTRLSKSGTQSCGTCHNPSYSWGDGMAKGVGDGMKTLKRRSPTVLNAAWGAIFMWDGRAADLEEQALGPILASAEMNIPIDKLLERLDSIASYKPLFEAAFPGKGISPEAIGKAIATFERTIVSGWAPFDAWIAGDAKAISPAAQRGFSLFNGKAGCAECHSGWNFTDDSFHDIGLPDPDIGRGEFVPVAVKMNHAFKTPGLREIVLRGPFMHDGSAKTLEAVVEHYDTGGLARPSRSDLMKPLGLSVQEKADLVAFMQSLSGEAAPISFPILPR